MSEFPELDKLVTRVESGQAVRQSLLSFVLLALALLFIVGVAAMAFLYFYTWGHV